MKKLEPTLDSRCGLYSGYKAHRKRNEQLCQPCRQAMRDYRRKIYDKDTNAKYAKKYKTKYPELIKERSKKYIKHVDPEVKAVRKSARAAETTRRQEARKADPAEKAKRLEYQRAYKAKNKEKINAWHREHRRNHPELYKARWAQVKNDPKIKRQQREYYLNNKKRIAQKNAEWNKANRDKNRESERRRRATRLQNGFEKYTEAQVIELYGHVCYLCNEEIEDRTCLIGSPGWERTRHIDHVIPIVQGGPDTLDNVRPTHAQCNLRKQKRLPSEFRLLS